MMLSRLMRSFRLRSFKFASLIFSLCIVAVLVSPLDSACAQVGNPKTKWSMIETPHFTVIYDSRQQQLGRLYATQAEQAFELVAPAFGVWPKKTVIVVDDGTDLANGSATPWPYPTIMAYPVLPTVNDSIGEYGDWGLELLTHEYTHILTFEPTTGLFKSFRWIFGSIIRPNGLLPRWYTEGLAVEMETRTSKFGRLRSATFLSIARAMVEEGTLRAEKIDRINESIPEWPGGNRPYLMGALVWDEITRRGGDKIIGELNLAYSRNIPFLIDRPLKARLGVDYETLLTSVYDRVEKRATEQIEAIRSAGSPRQEKLLREGYFANAPSISPDGQKLAFITRSHNIANYIVLKNRGNEQTPFNTVKGVKLAESSDINRVAWLPNSKSFIYDSISPIDVYYSYSDLWRCDLEIDESRTNKEDETNCKLTRLTRGLRAREPAVSPDATKVIFVRTTPGSTELASANIDGSKITTLYRPPFETRLSLPTFLNAEEVVFSERRKDGKEYLKLLKIITASDGNLKRAGDAITILPRYAPAYSPRMTPEGLIFISERNGVSNFYLARSDFNAARPITNVTTRILNGDYDSTTKELVYSRLESAGASLYAMPLSEGRKLPVALPTVAALIDSTYPELPKPMSPASFVAEDYRPGRWLIPQYWYPYGYFLPGGVYGQAQTTAFDPLGHHSLSLTVAGDTLSKKASIFGSYMNAQTPVITTLAGQHINEYLYSSGLIRQTTAGSLSGSFFLPKLSNSWRGGLGWQYLQTNSGSTSLSRQGPRATVSYRNVTQSGFEISPERGGSISISHAEYLSGLGNTAYGQTEIYASKFLSGVILPERHAIALFANANIAPNLNRTILGRSTVGGNYQNGLIQDSFVMRGYGLASSLVAT